MSPINITAIVFLLNILFINSYNAATKDIVYQLYNDLLTDGKTSYRKDVRPVTHSSEALYIYLGYYLLSLVSVDEKSQTITTNAELEIVWNDHHLSWELPAYDNITEVLVFQDKIWTPDITIGNSVVDFQGLGYDKLKIRIDHNGYVVWMPTLTSVTSCDIVITFYPFDTQICDVEIETASSRNDEIDISLDEMCPVSLDLLSKDGSWKIVDSSAKNIKVRGSKSFIKFSFLLERRTTFFVIIIVSPVLLMSLTSSLVFALPADSGEKMGTSLTILLAYAVYLTIVSDYLPSTSLQISVLALYLTIVLGITALSVVVTAAILCLHHTPDTEPVGCTWTKITKFIERCTTRRNKKEGKRNAFGNNEVRQICPPITIEKEEVNDISSSINDDEPLTWQQVAKVLDWFCFLLFTFLISSTTIVSMGILVIGGKVNKPTLSQSAYVE